MSDAWGYEAKKYVKPEQGKGSSEPVKPPKKKPWRCRLLGHKYMVRHCLACDVVYGPYDTCRNCGFKP